MDCPDHGPLVDGRCYECEHVDLLIDLALERRAEEAETQAEEERAGLNG